MHTSHDLQQIANNHAILDPSLKDASVYRYRGGESPLQGFCQYAPVATSTCYFQSPARETQRSELDLLKLHRTDPYETTVIPQLSKQRQQFPQHPIGWFKAFKIQIYTDVEPKAFCTNSPGFLTIICLKRAMSPALRTCTRLRRKSSLADWCHSRMPELITSICLLCLALLGLYTYHARQLKD